MCILILTKDKRVILVRQFRFDPNEILLELPGGGIKKGETPEQAGEQEFLEETGYRGNIKLVTETLNCAYSTMKRYCLVAVDCEKNSRTAKYRFGNS